MTRLQPTRDDIFVAGAAFSGEARIHPRRGPLTNDLHPGFELGIVLRGQVERHHDEHAMTLSRGDVWLNSPWEPHAWRTLRAHTANLVCGFLPEFFGHETLAGLSWLAPFAAPPAARPRADTADLRRLALYTARNILTETEKRRPAWQDACRLALLRLLLGLTRDWKPPSTSRGRAYARTHDLPRVMPAALLLQQQPTRHLPRAEAAAACGLSVSQFGWLFRRTVGESFGAYCMRARLDEAAKRLTGTRLSLEEIAAECGFSHGSHLYRLFVKHYGCSPGQYRQSGQRAPR